jgi:hypothetical protein
MLGMTIPLGEEVHFGAATHNISGISVPADASPKFRVYEQDTDTAIVDWTLMTSRHFEPSGLYRGSFTASVANGFEVGKFYDIVKSGLVNSIRGFDVDTIYIRSGVYDANILQQTGNPIGDLYYADIELNRNQSASRQDEYTVSWFRNEVPISGQNTFLQVIQRDGANLISTTAMSEIGSYGMFKRDETTNLVPAGESVIVNVSGIVDGVNRIWRKVISRESGIV